MVLLVKTSTTILTKQELMSLKRQVTDFILPSFIFFKGISCVWERIPAFTCSVSIQFDSVNRITQLQPQFFCKSNYIMYEATPPLKCSHFKTGWNKKRVLLFPTSTAIFILAWLLIRAAYTTNKWWPLHKKMYSSLQFYSWVLGSDELELQGFFFCCLHS